MKKIIYIILSIFLLASCETTEENEITFEKCIADSECNEIYVEDVIEDSSVISDDFSQALINNESTLAYLYSKTNNTGGKFYFTYTIHSDITLDSIEEGYLVLQIIADEVSDLGDDYYFEYSIQYDNGYIEMQTFSGMGSALVHFQLVDTDFLQFIDVNSQLLMDIISLSYCNSTLNISKGESSLSLYKETNSNRIRILYTNIDNEQEIFDGVSDVFSEYELIN